MKTIKKLLCAVLLILPFCGFAQLLGYTEPSTLDVKGVNIGGKYTKTQVEKKWGTPTKYWSGMSEFGLDEEYSYIVDKIKNLFRFSDDGIFNSFYVRTSNFPVYTKFKGGVKVGDNISKVQEIGLGTPVLQKNGTYHLDLGDDPLVFKHSKGVITEISFVSSI